MKLENFKVLTKHNTLEQITAAAKSPKKPVKKPKNTSKSRPKKSQSRPKPKPCKALNFGKAANPTKRIKFFDDPTPLINTQGYTTHIQFNKATYELLGSPQFVSVMTTDNKGQIILSACNFQANSQVPVLHKKSTKECYEVKTPGLFEALGLEPTVKTAYFEVDTNVTGKSRIAVNLSNPKAK